MYGLEYALFFGVPDNKLELMDGRSRWVFPFLEADRGAGADSPVPRAMADRVGPTARLWDWGEENVRL